MSKILTKISLISLFIYSIVVTFMLFQGVNPKKILHKYFSEVENDEKVNVEDEYKFITELLDDYFLIDKSMDSKKKYDDLSNKTQSGISSNFLLEFKSTIDLYIKNGALRDYELLKVIRNQKSKNYKVFVVMKSKFPQETQKEFLMGIDLKLNKDQDDNINLSEWKEKILTTRSKELLSKDIFLTESVATELRLPCDFISVAPIKNHQSVKMSWDSKNRKIKFVPNGILKDNVQFKTQCKDRFFVFNFTSDDNYQTIFYAFDMNDGVVIEKELTQREKDIKALESKMGVKVR